MSVYFVSDFNIVATCPSIPAARFAFCVLFVLFLLFIVVFLVNQAEPRARVCRPPPAISLLAVPRRLFCLWFFGVFSCGVLLFMVIYVVYKYKNR